MEKKKRGTIFILPILVVLFYFLIEKCYPVIYGKFHDSSGFKELFLMKKIIVFSLFEIICFIACSIILIIFLVVSNSELKKYHIQDVRKQLYIDRMLNGVNITWFFLFYGEILLESLAISGYHDISDKMSSIGLLVVSLGWLSLVGAIIVGTVGLVIHRQLLKKYQMIINQEREELLQDESMIENEKIRVQNEENVVYAKAFKLMQSMVILSYAIFAYLSMENLLYCIPMIVIGIILAVSICYCSIGIGKIKNYSENIKN